MKRILTAIAFCAIIAGCAKDNDVLPTTDNDVKVVFEISDKAGFGADTKSVKTAWAAGDQILVVFKPADGANADTYLLADCDQNTLRFRYDGSKWNLKDNNVSDISQLGTEGNYWAIHHRVSGTDDIIFNVSDRVTLKNYKGGEVLENRPDESEYSVEENVLTLGTIIMQKPSVLDLFQLSVPALPAKDWKMYICTDDMPLNDPNVRLSQYLSKEGLIEEGDIYLNSTEGYCGNIMGYYSPGVPNDGDYSFVFRSFPYAASSNESKDQAYIFCLTDGTDIYYYRKPRGTWDGSQVTFDFTLTKDKAYKLPDFSGDKWTKIIDPYTDLSPAVAGVYKTANSYIVSAAGDYKFRATHKGNSTSSTVGTINSAVVLWESFGTATAPAVGDLVKNVAYSDGYIRFTATAAEGNAVIAAKDASDKILWSWHIWLTDKPAEHVYAKSAGTVMDRNLGATSATPGEVGALGLLYQWGRKDPFLGSSAISGYNVAKSTITWPGKVESSAETGTIAYAVTHPTTFISNADVYSNRDWYYTGNNTTDNTRWTESENAKSVYDPCPAGWRVPDGGTDGIWDTADFDDPTFDATNKGKTFSNNGIEIWYPAAGYLAYDNVLSNAGTSLYCWTATPWPDSAHAINMYFKSGSQNLATNHGMRVIGCSVRCCKE